MKSEDFIEIHFLLGTYVTAPYLLLVVVWPTTEVEWSDNGKDRGQTNDDPETILGTFPGQSTDVHSHDSAEEGGNPNHEAGGIKELHQVVQVVIHHGRVKAAEWLNRVTVDVDGLRQPALTRFNF